MLIGNSVCSTYSLGDLTIASPPHDDWFCDRGRKSIAYDIMTLLHT